MSEVIAPTAPLSKEDSTKCHRNNSLKSATVIEAFEIPNIEQEQKKSKERKKKVLLIKGREQWTIS